MSLGFPLKDILTPPPHLLATFQWQLLSSAPQCRLSWCLPNAPPKLQLISPSILVGSSSLPLPTCPEGEGRQAAGRGRAFPSHCRVLVSWLLLDLEF